MLAVLGEGCNPGAVDRRDQSLKARGHDIGIDAYAPPSLSVRGLNLDVGSCGGVRPCPHGVFLIIDEIDFDPTLMLKRIFKRRQRPIARSRDFDLGIV